MALRSSRRSGEGKEPLGVGEEERGEKNESAEDGHTPCQLSRRMGHLERTTACRLSSDGSNTKEKNPVTDNFSPRSKAGRKPGLLLASAESRPYMVYLRKLWEMSCSMTRLARKENG